MSEAPLDVSALEPLVAQRDLILVTGKGGTGKTTVVAALARLARTRRGGAVAVEMAARPRLPDLLVGTDRIEVLNIDPEQAAIASLGRLTGHPTLARAVLSNRVLRSFVRTSPAMSEMIALDELVWRVDGASRRGVPVIVDLPATGHAMSFLETPRAVHSMLRLGPFAQVAARIEALLLNASRTELVVVSLPEELPVNETLELMRRAGALGIASRTVVVNRVPSTPLESGDRQMLATLSTHGEGVVARFAAGAQTALAGQDHARAQIDRLRDEAGVHIVELPTRLPPRAEPERTSSDEPTPGPATLSRLLDGAPLVVCVGPGGVGKTTISAVLALRQAAAGHHALVLTIDPARRLADALSIAGLTNDPTELTSFAKMHPAGTLSALMLDPMATFDHMVAMLVTDPARRASLLANRFYQHVSRGLAGTLEYMAVERLHQLQRTGRFDSIVLDTPPTTNALDFLDAPQRVTEFFGDRVVRWLLPQKDAPSWTARLLNRASGAALSLMSRVAGQGFVDETVGFLSAFGDLFGHFRARGLEVGALLRDPRTVFLVVAAPEPGRLAEAQTIDQRLSEAGCRPRAFILNRVEEPFLPSADELDAGIDRAATLLGDVDDRERVRSFVERLENLRHEQASTTAEHQSVVDAMRRHAGKRPVFLVPRVPAGQSPRAALLAMYVGLFAPEQAAPVLPPGGTPARQSAEPAVVERRHS